MRENKILFPICGILYPYRLDHDAFWLARYLSAQLCLVEVCFPTEWVKWLLYLMTGSDRHWRLRRVEDLVLQHDHVDCKAEAFVVPNLTIGITEAAWCIRPNFVALTPELQERLGKAGLQDLKTRLAEMRRCLKRSES